MRVRLVGFRGLPAGLPMGMHWQARPSLLPSGDIHFAPSIAPHGCPPPRAPCTDGIPDTAQWPTTHGRVRYAAWYAAARTKPSGSRRLSPPRGFLATRGGTAGAGRARGGWPLPACGKPMRIKPHQTVTVYSLSYIINIIHVRTYSYCTVHTDCM